MTCFHGRRVSLSIFGAAMSVGAASHAATLPPAVFTESIVWTDFTSYDGQDPFAPEVLTAADSTTHRIEWNYPGGTASTAVTTGFSGEASTRAKSRPTASATISVNGSGAGAGGGNSFTVQKGGATASASARVEYYVGVAPDSSLALLFNGREIEVPLKVFATVGASAGITGGPIVSTGPYATAGASVRVESSTPFSVSYPKPNGGVQTTVDLLGTTLMAASARDEYYTTPQTNPASGAAITFDMGLAVAAGSIERLKVILQAGASAQAFGGAYSNGRSDASGAVGSAFADPVFIVDPAWAYADLVDLSYSPLITQGTMPSAVPLPPSALLLGGALGAGALLRRRGARRAQEPGR